MPEGRPLIPACRAPGTEHRALQARPTIRKVPTSAPSLSGAERGGGWDGGGNRLPWFLCGSGSSMWALPAPGLGRSSRAGKARGLESRRSGQWSHRAPHARGCPGCRQRRGFVCSLSRKRKDLQPVPVLLRARAGAGSPGHGLGLQNLVLAALPRVRTCARPCGKRFTPAASRHPTCRRRGLRRAGSPGPEAGSHPCLHLLCGPEWNPRPSEPRGLHQEAGWLGSFPGPCTIAGGKTYRQTREWLA